MRTYTPAQRFADQVALLDAAVGLARLEFDEHPRTAAQTRRLDRLLDRAAAVRTAALHAALLDRPCQRLVRRIVRMRDRLGDLSIDLEIADLGRERGL
jgi:hypothetical protein